MRKLFVLLTVLCAVSALAESALLWKCDFEASEGYTTGQLIGQQGWYKVDGTVNNRELVENNPNYAASGSQYVGYNSSAADSGRQICTLKFDDVKNKYPAGSNNKLLVSWDMGYSNNTGILKFYNFGDTGKNKDVEIIELTLYSYYLSTFVTKPDKSGTMQVNVNNVDEGWHHCTMLLDPSNRMIVEFTVDDVVVAGLAGTYYKNEADGNTRGGDFIDGIGIRKKGYYDNFKVEMIPEPGFLGLLALLGLFFARKQR